MCRYCNPNVDFNDFIKKQVEYGPFEIELAVSLTPPLSKTRERWTINSFLSWLSMDGIDDNLSGKIEVSYCPFCGRKLEKSEKEKS